MWHLFCVFCLRSFETTERFWQVARDYRCGTAAPREVYPPFKTGSRCEKGRCLFKLFLCSSVQLSYLSTFCSFLCHPHLSITRCVEPYGGYFTSWIHPQHPHAMTIETTDNEAAVYFSQVKGSRTLLWNEGCWVTVTWWEHTKDKEFLMSFLTSGVLSFTYLLRSTYRLNTM